MVYIPGKDVKEEHKRIKQNIEYAYDSFRNNYIRFNEMRNFVFSSSVNATERAVNQKTNRPTLESPILEPMISRLRGEFAKNEPSIKVMSRPDSTPDPQQILVVEGIIRHLIDDSNARNNLGYNIYTDTLTGGFSAAKIYTDYASEKSFDLELLIDRTFDPTMTFWDPMAMYNDKSDGEYCGELFAMYEEDFKRDFKKSTGEIKFNNKIGGFQWSYKNLNRKTLIVCDYYEKKMKKMPIVKIANGLVMTRKEYQEMLKRWDIIGVLGQPPVIIDERSSNLQTIVRYRLNETEILSYEETDYDELPIVFADGNSVLLKDNTNAGVMQMTRPIVLPARDTQRLKNYAMQALANELENIQQSPWMIPKEGIPALYKEAWVTPQLASVLVFNPFKDDNPEIPLPLPQMVQRRPIPPEIMQTFMQCDQTVQNILGAFDPAVAKLGEREVSGKAIIQSLAISNASAMPYVKGYLMFLQGVANRLLEMIPKIYNTKRTIPVLMEDGKRHYVKIDPDGKEGVSLGYDKNAMNVKVEAGASFGAQKEKAYAAIIEAMQVNQSFAQFINTKGLPQFLDNMPDIRGIDQLKQSAEQWQQQMEEMQKQAAKQPNPEAMWVQVEAHKNQARAQLDQAKLQQEAAQQTVQNQMQVAELALEKQRLELEIAELKAKIAVDVDKSESEKMIKLAELAIKRADAQTKELSERQKMLDTVIEYELERKRIDAESKRSEEMTERSHEVTE